MNVRRRARRIALAAALVPLALGCADPDVVCGTEDNFASEPNGERIVGPARMGEVLLSAENLAFSTSFELEIDGLPKVWVGENPVKRPFLEVSLELDYPDPQPPGAELPEVTAVIDTGRIDIDGLEAEYATTILGRQFSQDTVAAAVCGSDSDPGCCPYGASRCGGTAMLVLTRAADLFPPVRIRYAGSPSIFVYTCLKDERTPTWTIEETAP